MDNYKDKLINKPESFMRKTFELRMTEYGFKNIERMEKFLWDLELFLQIQEELGEKVVLKGGAAIQFYLPLEAQRTSVDIDMMFYGKQSEIMEALERITNKLEIKRGLFVFREHIPKKPKTTLPLYTYFVDVPSVLTAKELRMDTAEIATQEVKVEFIVQDEAVETARVKGNNIFAVNSNFEYQILPLNYLFADKLTTLGPNTIGVQDERLDEQIKQFYDIWMLTQYHFSELEIDKIRDKYLKRAKQECIDRHNEFDVDMIKADVRKQLLRFKGADSGADAVLKKTINDFNSLYLNAKVDFSPQIVASGASLVELMYETILEGKDWGIVNTALEIQELLQLKGVVGKERGFKNKEIREMLIMEFGSYSSMDLSVLKGKRPNRIFWSVVNMDNVDEIMKKMK